MMTSAVELYTKEKHEAGKSSPAYRFSVLPKTFVTCNPDILQRVMPFPGQIAGHGEVKHKSDGTILKPMQPPPKSTREVAFYTRIQSSDHPDDVAISELIPRFYGVERHEIRNGEELCKEYLLIEDLTWSYQLPNIMDIKIGARTWGPDATEAKARSEAIKYPGTKAPLGFSILGLIVHPIDSNFGNQSTRHDKSFGKEIKTSEVTRMARVYFDADRSGPVASLVHVVIERLNEIVKVQERQRRYHFYASSILFVYDVAQVRQFLANGDQAILERAVKIKMIDFAHVFPSDGTKDSNFSDGLRNLIQVFRDYLDEIC